MHVAHIIDQVDGIGGVQTYLAGLLPALQERGVSSTLLVGRGSRKRFAGAPLVTAPEAQLDGPDIPPPARESLRRKLEAVDADIAFVHIGPSPGVARATAAHIPTVVFAHDYFPACPGNARYLHNGQRFCSEGPGARCFARAYTELCTNRRPDRLLRAVRRERAWRTGWESVTRIVVASPFVAEVLAAGGAPADRMTVIPYFFVPQQTAAPASDPFDVLFLGRLVPIKGADVLLDALGKIPSATAVIGGDGPELARLEGRSQSLGLDGRVRFVGRVDAETRATLFAAARVFALPSRWSEPFGIAGVEALAVGVPVVASDTGGIPFWLDRDAGELVPPGDVHALADALTRVLDDEDARTRMATSARRSAERFSRDAHVMRLIEIFDDARRWQIDRRP